jgi:hypothetical protein
MLENRSSSNHHLMQIKPKMARFNDDSTSVPDWDASDGLTLHRDLTYQKRPAENLPGRHLRAHKLETVLRTWMRSL